MSESDRNLMSNDQYEDLVNCTRQLEDNRINSFPHPLSKGYRFFGLAFMCILSFGNYFCYDNPAALQDHMLKDLDMNNKEYGLLYSIYSWPNVILPVFGGVLVDKILGVRSSAILFAAFIMLGQLFVAFGAMLSSYKIIVIGRIIFALGGENLLVSQNSYTVKWFLDRELCLVFGLQLSFSRLGSTINMYVMPLIYSWVDSMTPMPGGPKTMGLTLFIGAISTIVSFGASLVLMYLDKQLEKARQAESTRGYDSLVQSETELERPDTKIDLSHIFRFPISFWLLTVICMTFYSAVFPFVSYGLVFFEHKYRLPPYPWSEVCNSLIYFISIVLSGPFGALISRIGRNAQMVLLSVVLALLAHYILALTTLTPFVPVVILGIGYSLLAAAFWPCIAFIVEYDHVGTAFGVITSVQNLVLALVFISTGSILDSSGYIALEIFFILFLSVSFFASMILWLIDGLSKYPLLSVSAEKREENMRLALIDD